MKAFCEATHNSQSSKRRDPPPKSTQHSTPTGTRNRGLSRTTTATYTLAVHKLQRGPLSVCQNRMPCDLHVHDLIGLRSPSSFFCAGLFRFRVASGRFPFRRSDRSVVRSEHAIERHGVQHRSHPSAPSARAWPRRARARSRIVTHTRPVPVVAARPVLRSCHVWRTHSDAANRGRYSPSFRAQRTGPRDT